MCLDVVLKRKEFLSRTKIEKHKKNSELKVGWKAVVIRKGKITPPHFYVTGESLSTGKWLNEKDFRRDAYFGETKIGTSWNAYKIGFHILATYKDAEQYGIAAHLRFSKVRLVKVYYKKAIAYGKQEGCYTVISKEMYIPRQTPFTSFGNKCKNRLE